MAILNGYEGPARVVVERDGLHWKGYILLDPANVAAFDGAGPPSSVLYEGPVLIAEHYRVSSGEARVFNVQISAGKLMVEFEGVRILIRGETLPARPPDFLSEN